MKINLILCFVLFAFKAFSFSVTFHDGAGRVGGSCAILSNDETRVMIDCGALGGEEAALRSYAKYGGFPFDPTKVGALFITHAHQDHAGRVPDLIRAGFRGRIITSKATKELLRMTWMSNILYDSSINRTWRWSSFQGQNNRTSLHWRPDCPWGSRIKRHNLCSFEGSYNKLIEQFEAKDTGRRTTVCASCREAEVSDLLARVECVDFDVTNKFESLTYVFHPTKHLPGASAIYFSNAENSCVFSGDLGTLRSRFVKDLPPAPKSDMVFVEATYGAEGKDNLEETKAEYLEFQKLIGETLSTNGLVWIPAFALDRTQRVLVEIGLGKKAGIIPDDVPIFLPSSTARKNTEVYATNTVWFDTEDIKLLSGLLKESKSGLGRKNPATLKRAILVTTSGMMDAALSYELLPSLLPRNDVSLCLVGYQAPGTPGAMVKDGEKSISIKKGKESISIPVNCNVRSFNCFSGHADAKEVDSWLSNNKDSRIYLVHGDKAALEARKEDLHKRGFQFPAVVKPAVPYDVKSQKVSSEK